MAYSELERKLDDIEYAIQGIKSSISELFIELNRQYAEIKRLQEGAYSNGQSREESC